MVLLAMYRQIKEKFYMRFYRQTSFSRQIILTTVVLGLILFGLVAYQLHNLQGFRVTSTNPAINNVATVSPFFDVIFNKRLASSNLSVYPNSPFIKSLKISNEELNISLVGPLNIGQTYTITIVSIYDYRGDHIVNKKISFVPKNIPTYSLPIDQQQLLLLQQIPQTPSKANITFLGTDALENYGVTAAQINNLEQALFNYKQLAQTVSIDTSSIAVTPHNPTSSNNSSIINFNVSIDGNSLKARIDYSQITNLRLYLYDIQNGNLLFDSGTII